MTGYGKEEESMMQEAQDRLKHRKGSARLVLTDKDGSVKAGREVRIRMRQHEFLFGCTEFSAHALANGELEGLAKEQAQERFRHFFEVFNASTLSFYWGRFEPVQGQPDTIRTRKTAQWFKEKNITLKGHPLCWHTVCAPWLMEMSNKDILTTQLNRIRRDVNDFEGLIDMWDVINEVVIMPFFDKYDNAITRICKELGRIRLVREVFGAAKRANPNATLLLNDFWTDEAYDILIEGCLEAGIPIDVVGIQSHMHQGYWGVEKTQEILERYGRFRLPIHFTENTLVSGDIMPRHIVDLNDYQVDAWPSTPDGLERQAREVETHYTTLFENDLVESITWWGMLDGGWLKAPSGLLTADSKPKPAYDALYELVRKKWWTPDQTLVTDADGAVTVSGFRGQYEAVCDDETVSFKISRSSDPGVAMPHF